MEFRYVRKYGKTAKSNSRQVILDKNVCIEKMKEMLNKNDQF